MISSDIPQESNWIYDIPGLVFFHNTSAFRETKHFPKHRHFTQTEALESSVAKCVAVLY